MIEGWVVILAGLLCWASGFCFGIGVERSSGSSKPGQRSENEP